MLPACSSKTTDRTALQQQDSAVAESKQVSDPGYNSHTEAAIAAALGRNPGLVNPAVTAAVVIFSDETTVDLRAQVQADDDYCQWFGVNAELIETAIRWRAGPVGNCDN